jgi:chemotaxis protein CheD
MSLVFQDKLPALVSDEFAYVERYWDPCNQTFAAKIAPGEYYVSASTELITGAIGTCVAACVRDTRLGIGGMNHFMVPGLDDDGLNGISGQYGVVAMEHLIDCIVSHGGEREHLEFKIFGGAHLFDDDTNCGSRNITFITEYLRFENFFIAAYDLGGPHPRKIEYEPKTGQVTLKKLRDSGALKHRELAYHKRLLSENNVAPFRRSRPSKCL